MSRIIDNFKNARVTLIQRPGRTGIGGKVVSFITVFAPSKTGSNAIYQPIDELELGSFAHLTDSRDSLLDGLLFMDLSPEDTELAIQPGDLLTFKDPRNVEFTDVEVRQANLNAFGSDIDHWELGLSGLALGN